MGVRELLNANEDRPPNVEPSNPQPNSFPLLSLPPEIITRIVTFWSDTRLGLPTSAINSYLAPILRNHLVITARVLRHYQCTPRALTAECGRLPADLAVVRVLLDVFHRRGEVLTPDTLEAAAYGGDHGLVMLLIHRGAPGLSGALAAAAGKGHEETVTTLLAHGAGVESFSRMGLSALVLACINGHCGVVRMLLDRGANPNPTGLYAAAGAGRWDIVELLLRAGSKPDYYEALHVAVSGGHVHVVKELLGRGANPNGVQGRPLRAACAAGRLDIVQCLVEGGADVNILADWPVDIARSCGHMHIVTYLLANGARTASSYF